MSDFLRAVARIRHEFERLNLNPPKMILLASHDEGTRMLASVTWPPLSYSCEPAFVLDEGEEFREVMIYGIKVRWPARRKALPDGRSIAF